MKQYIDKFPVEKMATVFGVLRSGFYKYLIREESFTEAKNNDLLVEIKAIYKKNRQA